AAPGRNVLPARQPGLIDDAGGVAALAERLHRALALPVRDQRGGATIPERQVYQRDRDCPAIAKRRLQLRVTQPLHQSLEPLALRPVLRSVPWTPIPEIECHELRLPDV